MSRLLLFSTLNLFSAPCYLKTAFLLTNHNRCMTIIIAEQANFFHAFLIVFPLPISVVFSDSSSSCLLVWTGICCPVVTRAWCERQCWRQGELVRFFPLSNDREHYMKEDHRSYKRNFCSCEKKAWKKFRLVRDSNPWPLWYRCSALPIKLTRQLGARRWIGSL